VAGLDGNLAAEVRTSAGSTTTRWQLVNLHGDAVTSAADSSTLSTPDGATLDADEFGDPTGAATRPLRLARRRA
jgi:hypothetical protein